MMKYDNDKEILKEKKVEEKTFNSGCNRYF